MAVIVTGAAGFMGKQLCERLLARGERVVGAHNCDADCDVRLNPAAPRSGPPLDQGLPQSVGRRRSFRRDSAVSPSQL